jgi:histone H3/H4
MVRTQEGFANNVFNRGPRKGGGTKGKRPEQFATNRRKGTPRRKNLNLNFYREARELQGFKKLKDKDGNLISLTHGSAPGGKAGRKAFANIIPKLAFARIVRDIVRDYGEYRIQASALLALQEGAEMKIVETLARAGAMSIHASRQTLMLRDIFLYIWTMQEKCMTGHKYNDRLQEIPAPQRMITQLNAAERRKKKQKAPEAESEESESESESEESDDGGSADGSAHGREQEQDSDDDDDYHEEMDTSGDESDDLSGRESDEVLEASDSNEPDLARDDDDGSGSDTDESVA